MRSVLAAAILIASLPAQAASLTVHIQNVDPKGGILRVSLYDEAGWSKSEDSPLASANVPAVAPETVVRLADIKPGIYGLKMFQDTNANGKFDQNFLGLPLERFGFSRDAQPILSEPGFDRTEFSVKEGDNQITVHLQ